MGGCPGRELSVVRLLALVPGLRSAGIARTRDRAHPGPANSLAAPSPYISRPRDARLRGTQG